MNLAAKVAPTFVGAMLLLSQNRGSDRHKKNRQIAGLLIVIKLGFEPRTPSLKGMCSTC